MALSILNNISSLMAQNQLSITGSGLQKTLQRLSSGSKINTGADDAAGLAIADGMSANIAALTQSAQNATSSTGKLQTADGALSQVTTLLQRAVTLATEAANGTIAAGQSNALDTEFQSILSEINSIGSNTTFNGSAIFQGGSANYNQIKITPTSPAGSATAVSGTMTIKDTGGSAIYTTSASDTTVGALINDINNSGKGLVASLDSGGNLVITDSQNRSVSATGADALTASYTGFAIGTSTAATTNYSQIQLGGMTLATAVNDTLPNNLYITEGSYSFGSNGSNTTVADLINDINTHSGRLNASLDGSGNLVITDTTNSGTSANPLTFDYVSGTIGGTNTAFTNTVTPGVTATPAAAANTTNASTFSTYLSDSTTTGSSLISVIMTALSASGLGLSGQSLTSQNVAQTALTAINVAVSTIAGDRGNLGAAMNRLTAATNVMNNQVQNLSNAQDGITAADIGKEVANMTKFNVLQQTGIAALQQANQAQQSILKLLQ